MVGEEGNVNAGGVDIDAGIDTGAGVWSWWEWFGADGRGNGGVCESGVGHFDVLWEDKRYIRPFFLSFLRELPAGI